MSSHPRVSIGLPVYNGARYLVEALESILSQSYQDFELMISDNASRDSTREICMRYARMDSRIRYHRNATNVGAAANFNRTFELSRGSLFKWAAHDDVLAPDFLDKCVRRLDEVPDAVMCYPSSVSFIDEHGRKIKSDSVGVRIDSDDVTERFARFSAMTGGLCYAIFGIIRSDVLQRTDLIGSYVSSDRVLLAWLALHGPFCEVGGDVFMNRDHPERSVRALGLYYRSGWFDTRRRGKIAFHYWRLLREYARVLHRVDLSTRERLSCYRSLSEWCLRNWKVFAIDEFRLAAGAFIKMRYTRAPQEPGRCRTGRLYSK